MRVWPVILDSRPPYLRDARRTTSLLLAPVGASVLIEQLMAALQAVTDNPPLVLAPGGASPDYDEALRGHCAGATVLHAPGDFAVAFARHELSDALLFIDPKCLPVRGYDFSRLLHEYVQEPRIAHHLVCFEQVAVGTQERLALDAAGQVRAIQRHYELATWPFLGGVLASLVPSACGIGAEERSPASLNELRQMLTDAGVPARDVLLDGPAHDLREERGILAANEQHAHDALGLADQTEAERSPLRVGHDQVIDPTARLLGPIVIHGGARVGAGATILGPAVIGERAHVGRGAVIAHATIGPDSVVPAETVVRDRAWFGHADANAAAPESQSMSYGERLARIVQNARDQRAVEAAGPSTYFVAKRVLDFAVAAIGLTLLSPLLAIIAAAIRLESEGPVFYGDKREGRRSRRFKCWKFRTMYTGAHLAQRQLAALDQTDGPHFKVDRDPRVTRVGRILRALNLDEVPQLFNVLTGEMSLVGPRPSPFRENQVCVPWRAARLSVRPGITGFWQVCRHNRAAGDFHQWIEYDLLYVQHLSMWLDAKILVATLLTLGGKLGHVPTSRLLKKTRTPELFDARPQPQVRQRVDAVQDRVA
jgi:lipopolysaccharide/colanic/teichoic acid biosynthesis glycosyltransferase